MLVAGSWMSLRSVAGWRRKMRKRESRKIGFRMQDGEKVRDFGIFLTFFGQRSN